MTTGFRAASFSAKQTPKEIEENASEISMALLVYNRFGKKGLKHPRRQGVVELVRVIKVIIIITYHDYRGQQLFRSWNRQLN